jgi:hypothetical protein
MELTKGHVGTTPALTGARLISTGYRIPGIKKETLILGKEPDTNDFAVEHAPIPSLSSPAPHDRNKFKTRSAPSYLSCILCPSVSSKYFSSFLPNPQEGMPELGAVGGVGAGTAASRGHAVTPTF